MVSEIISNFAALNSRFTRRFIANPLMDKAMSGGVDVRNSAGEAAALPSSATLKTRNNNREILKVTIQTN